MWRTYRFRSDGFNVKTTSDLLKSRLLGCTGICNEDAFVNFIQGYFWGLARGPHKYLQPMC